MSVFKFKQFAINQTESPAKITTDATVFAASIQFPLHAKSALEIGTGTGVISLMLAQRYTEIEIDAIEINPIAFNEAEDNFKNAPWNQRLKVILGDFNQFRSPHLYEVIFSNPPFFNHHLQSDTNQGKNTAYHTNELSFNALATGLDQNLAENGEAHIMLPPYEMSLFEKEIQSLGFKCQRSTELRHQPRSKIIRLFNVYKRGQMPSLPEKKHLYIRDEYNNFHPSYIHLMKDFLTIF